MKEEISFRIKTLVSRGWRVYQISAILGYSEKTVRSWMNGVQTPREPHKILERLERLESGPPLVLKRETPLMQLIRSKLPLLLSGEKY